MSNQVLHEFLPKIQAVLRKFSLSKSDRESTDDQEGTEVQVQERFLTDKKYKTELCKNFMRTGCCRFGAKCCYAHD